MLTPTVFIAILFAVLCVNVAAVILMGASFRLVLGRGSWSAAMRSLPNGHRSLANRLMAWGGRSRRGDCGALLAAICADVHSMRYRLSTLLIVLALGPPVLAGAWLIATAFASPVRVGPLGTDPLLAAAIVLVIATLAIERG